MQTPKSRTVSGSSCRMTLDCLSTASRVLRFVIFCVCHLGGFPMKVVQRIDPLAINYRTIDHIRGLKGVLRHGLDSRFQSTATNLFLDQR